jgi:hypothetical protein
MRGITDPVTDVFQAYSDLNPTPEQAQAVVQADEDYRAAEAALARRLQDHPGEETDVIAELQAMQQAREEQLRRTFGSEAYNASKGRADSTYKRLQQFAVAWELQEQEIPRVAETLRAFHDDTERRRAAAAMREAAGQRVDWHEVNAGIEQARQQTEAGLQNLIGGRRLSRLKQNGLLTFR